MPMKAFRFASFLVAASFLVGTPAFAVNKDMIQLQTQVQQLQDAVARLQQSNDERMGALQNLVQQSADQTTKAAAAVDAIQHQLANQQEAGGGKIDQVSGQVQALNDALDEIKARLGRLEKLMQSIQNQQGTIAPGAAPLSAAPEAAPEAAPVSPASGSAPQAAATPVPDGFSNATAEPVGRRSKPSAGTPVDTGAPAPAATAPPVDQLYKTALGDYMSAKYGLAQSEFADLSRAYPDHPLSGNSFYYQGEIDYRGARYGAAVQNYDRVIEQFPQSNKVPAAHLHKGQALIQLKQTEAGIRELRALIQRYPNSPEALQARSRLSGLGVPVHPRG